MPIGATMGVIRGRSGAAHEEGMHRASSVGMCRLPNY